MLLYCYVIKYLLAKIMNEEKTKVVHLYFSADHIQEIDEYIAKNKHDTKNENGRAYSRNDYFLEVAAEHAKKLGLKTNPRMTDKTKELK